MTTIGHPFDTTKVRMQASATQYHSALQCIRQTVSKEGVLALCKGLTPAIVTTCLTSGLRFGVQHEFNARLVQYVSARRGPALGHRCSGLTAFQPRLASWPRAAAAPHVGWYFPDLHTDGAH